MAELDQTTRDERGLERRADERLDPFRHFPGMLHGRFVQSAQDLALTDDRAESVDDEVADRRCEMTQVRFEIRVLHRLTSGPRRPLALASNDIIPHAMPRKSGETDRTPDAGCESSE